MIYKSLVAWGTNRRLHPSVIPQPGPQGPPGLPSVLLRERIRKPAGGRAKSVESHETLEPLAIELRRFFAEQDRDVREVHLPPGGELQATRSSGDAARTRVPPKGT